MRWTSYAPGSLMLFGEHAVLHSKPAIAASVNHWLSIDWQLTDQSVIHIHSQLGEHRTTWQTLDEHPNMRFVISLLRIAKSHYPNLSQHGLSLHIKSHINTTQGLGSSSAVIAAMLVGLSQLQPELTHTPLAFRLGLTAIQHVQGAGSGTDLASALTGGVIYFDPISQQCQRLCDHLPIVSVYVGYKTPTAEVIRYVQQHWSGQPVLWQQWLEWNSQLTQQAAKAIRTNQYDTLGRLMDMAHGLMHGLGVSDTQLDQLAHQLRQQPNIYGAKISGSGLGDCVIALGTLNHPIDHSLDISVSPQAAYVSVSSAE